MTLDQTYPTRDRDRLLSTLERLLELDATELRPTLNQASQLVTETLNADKVDAFLYEAATESLVALGTSDTPMGRHQQAIGMDRLPLANGGRSVEVFRTGRCYLSGQVDQDPDELKGVKEGLGVRSLINCPLTVASERRGVLQAVSASPTFFSEQDLRFLEAVARWVGMVTHRAELVEQLEKAAVERGRHAALKEMTSLLTPRQREIAALITLGLSNAEIARQLVITQGTVANHIAAILEKLGAPSRARIAAIITEHRVGQPESDSTK